MWSRLYTSFYLRELTLHCIGRTQITPLHILTHFFVTQKKKKKKSSHIIKLWQIHYFACPNLHICIKYEDWNNKYAHSAIWHHIFSFPFTNQKKAFLFFLPSWFHLYLKIYSVLFLFIYLFILYIYKATQRLFFFRSLGYLLLDN